MPRKPTVICLGDSHTHGTFGASWVRNLEAALPGLHFVNTGVNGTQVKNLHARLSNLIPGVEWNAKLVGVTLLIGTNDCLLSLAQDSHDFWGQQYYRLTNGDIGPANVETFQKQFRALLAELTVCLHKFASSASGALAPIKLLIITLPPIGEAFDSRSNQRVDEYNAIIHAATAELQNGQHQYQQQQQLSPKTPAAAGLHIDLIDLNAQCKVAVRRTFTSEAAAEPVLSEGPRRLPSPFWRCGVRVASCLLRRYLLGVSYELQSRRAGTVVLTPDCVHLNEAGARLLSGLMEPHLQPLRSA